MVIKMEIEKLEAAFSSNCGILKTSQLRELKIDSRKINKLLQKEIIEKIATGYYCLSFDNVSEAAIISRLFPDAILWHNTALFYYSYSDRTPLKWDVIISKNASPSRFNIKYPLVQPFFVSPSRLTYGITTIEIDSCIINIFDRDRLICECLKYESNMDSETFNKAIQAYLKDSKKNVNNLINYAKKRKVLNRVKDVIGVWL